MLGTLADPGQSDVERRLESLEREQIVTFAVREALRAAPLLSVAGPESVHQLATPCFRAILTACVAAFAAERPDGPTQISANSASMAAFVAANAAFANASLARVAHAALYAAARAGTAAIARSPAAAAYAAFGAAYCSARAAASPDSMLEQSRLELDMLESELSAAQLRALPLWTHGAPAAFNQAVERMADVLSLGVAPCVLTDWYVGKTEGWPELRPYERRWAMAPERLWGLAPAELSAALAAIRDNA